jgi:hypothetical protein
MVRQPLKVSALSRRARMAIDVIWREEGDVFIWIFDWLRPMDRTADERFPPDRDWKNGTMGWRRGGIFSGVPNLRVCVCLVRAAF